MCGEERGRERRWEQGSSVDPESLFADSSQHSRCAALVIGMIDGVGVRCVSPIIFINIRGHGDGVIQSGNEGDFHVSVVLEKKVPLYAV